MPLKDLSRLKNPKLVVSWPRAACDISHSQLTFGERSVDTLVGSQRSSDMPYASVRLDQTVTWEGSRLG